MPRKPDWEAATIEFPGDGAFRVHRAPTQLRPRDTNTPRDRFDDPDQIYRVRYLATTLNGALLEVLDHFRLNVATEDQLGRIGLLPAPVVNILDEELGGSVPELWLSLQRIAHATIDHGQPIFIDVTNPELLAALNQLPRIRAALRSDIVRSAIGPSARVDEGTIRLVGPAGRAITQAVSREVYDAPIHAVGISYISRFSIDERCWAVFDDRIYTQFDPPVPLENTDRLHLTAVNEVAEMYSLILPPNWIH
jgi:hypothetical protein